MRSDPAHVVLVPGACCGPWIWRDVISLLDLRGILTKAVTIPSVGAEGPRGDLYDDAAATRAAMDSAGGPVVLVGHSSGGMIITEAAVGRDDVEHLVYLAAPVPEEGEALFTMEGAPDPADTFEVLNEVYELGDDGSVRFKTTAVDLPFGPDTDAAAIERAQAEMLPMAMIVYSQPVSGAPWHTIPSTFARCELDGFGNSILKDLMDVSASRAQRTVTFPTGHSPMLSRPDLVADLLAEIATA